MTSLLLARISLKLGNIYICRSQNIYEHVDIVTLDNRHPRIPTTFWAKQDEEIVDDKYLNFVKINRHLKG